MENEVKTYVEQHIKDFYATDFGVVFDAQKLIDCLNTKFNITDSEEVKAIIRYAMSLPYDVDE